MFCDADSISKCILFALVLYLLYATTLHQINRLIILKIYLKLFVFFLSFNRLNTIMAHVVKNIF